MSDIKVLQDLGRVDFQNPSPFHAEIHQGIKEAFDSGIQLIFAQDFPTLEIALSFPFKIIIYDASLVTLADGSQARFWIQSDHAAVMGECLSQRDLFNFQLFMSTWKDDSMSFFLEALKKGSSKITRLSIHHITGDEFTAKEAKGLAHWIHSSSNRAVRFWRSFCNHREYRPIFRREDLGPVLRSTPAG